MKKIPWIALILLLVAAGCTTSRITTSWKAENTVAKKYNKIMVMGLIRETDRSIEENMENHFVDDLKGMGYNAVSSLQEYGPKAFDNMSEEMAVSKLKNSGVDAVITIVLLDKQKERKYIPGNYFYYSPYYSYHNRFWGYRTVLYSRIYEPGYYVTNTKYFWESNLYEMDSQKLVYSAQSQSFDPGSSESLGHEYGQILVNDMVKKNVISKDAVMPVKGF